MSMREYVVLRARWLLGTVTRYFGFLSAFVLGGLACGTAAFFLVLHSAYGILPTHLLFSRKAAEQGATTHIALLHSNYSVAAVAQIQGDHRKQVALWEAFLKEAGADVHRIEDAELERGLDRRYQALVLPGSLALSDAERVKILSFVQSGGGLLMEGPVGTRDEKNDWRGWDFIKDLIHAAAIEVLPSPGQTRRFVALAGGHPITVQIPPGVKMENGFYGENYGVRTDTPVAYWSEWVRPLSQPAPYLAAVKTQLYGAGRVAWLGFSLGSMSEQSDPHRHLIRLLANVTDWVAEQPLAQVSTWPHGEQGAVNLTFDCESDFTNISNILNHPDAKSLRFTFFMLSSVAQRYPDLVKQAAGRGEVAIHGDDHSVFSQQPFETQVQRLSRAKSLLETLSQTAIVSFRPPEQQFDANTLAAMRKVGLRNIFADYLGSASPRADAPPSPTNNFLLPFRSAGAPVLRMPRSNYDDYDLFVRNPLDAQRAAEFMVADLSQVTRDGGLYISSMHTTAPWGGLNPDKVGALTTLLRAGAGRPLWVTTVKEAADWWEQRAQIQVKATKYSASVILLQVTNSNRQSMEDLPVEVYLPQNYSKVEIQSSKVDFQTPRWRFNAGGPLVLTIPAIKGGESKSYIITNGQSTD